MFGKENNPDISHMAVLMNIAIKGRPGESPCAEEIIPMIKALYEKSINAEIKWDETGVGWLIKMIVEMLPNLARNTRNYEKLNDEDFASLKKIFDELDALHTEIVSFNSQSNDEYNLAGKISCISKILYKNTVHMHDSEEDHHDWRDGMIFQNYEDLWKIIHRITTEWDELCNRGFSINVFLDYCNSFQYDRANGTEPPEKKKFETFMEMLDGKVKFVPVYLHEYRLLGIKVLANDADNEIIFTSENKSVKSYRLRQKGEEVAQSEVTEDYSKK